jgi:hypothetical protein
MAAKKVSAKKSASTRKASSSKGGVEESQWGYLDKKGLKAGMQARGRASKVGKPVGDTVGGRDAGPRGKALNSTFFNTTVEGPYGTTMFVRETKKINKFRPDSRKTTISEGYPNRKSQAGDLGSARTQARRAASAKRNKKK